MPFRQRCPRCGWQGALIAPQSDALTAGDFAGLLERCPHCGAAELEVQPEREGLLTRLAHWLRHPSHRG